MVKPKRKPGRKRQYHPPHDGIGRFCQNNNPNIVPQKAEEILLNLGIEPEGFTTFTWDLLKRYVSRLLLTTAPATILRSRLIRDYTSILYWESMLGGNAPVMEVEEESLKNIEEQTAALVLAAEMESEPPLDDASRGSRESN